MRERALLTLQGHTRAVNAVVLTSDGLKAVLASEDRSVAVWEVDAGRLVGDVRPRFGGSGRCGGSRRLSGCGRRRRGQEVLRPILPPAHGSPMSAHYKLSAKSAVHRSQYEVPSTANVIPK